MDRKQSRLEEPATAQLQWSKVAGEKSELLGENSHHGSFRIEEHTRVLSTLKNLAGLQACLWIMDNYRQLVLHDAF